MFDFLTVAVWAFIAYVLIVMLLTRRERRTIITMMGDKVTPEMLNQQLPLPWFGGRPATPDPTLKRRGYGALRAACLLVGIGLGLIAGLFLNIMLAANAMLFERLNNDLWQMGGVGIIYTAAMLLFGGLGLLVAFIIENNSKKNHIS